MGITVNRQTAESKSTKFDRSIAQEQVDGKKLRVTYSILDGHDAEENLRVRTGLGRGKKVATVRQGADELRVAVDVKATERAGVSVQALEHKITAVAEEAGYSSVSFWESE